MFRGARRRGAIVGKHHLDHPRRAFGAQFWRRIEKFFGAARKIDGGVKLDNIGRIARAGADTFVAGSAIFGSTDYAATIRAMRGAIAAT